MKTLFEQNGGTYTKVGDYYFPNLTVPTKVYEIGKYGRLHREFIEKNHPSFYTIKLMDGTLFEYLSEIDTTAKSMLDRLVNKMATKSGITEKLKSTDQMKWVRLMNNIKAQAEEIIMHEVVYVREEL